MIDVSLSHVSKRYRLRNPESDGVSALQRLAARLFPPEHDFWALRDVTFEVQRGETTGIIGHNGAGKSTLMKLLSGITAPSDGEIRIHGRLAALIELGSGFHPELTGRENVFMSAAILGMRRREIQAKFDSIVEFAGIGEFIDVPVKWYSSGMYVRLGFAIAAHIDLDILLVDEVLAVGDAAFQAKCFNRIGELKRAGTTILMITHDLGAIERLATRAVLLDHGQVKEIGPAREVVSLYQRAVNNPEEPGGDAPAEAPIAITDVKVLDLEGRDLPLARTGGSLGVRVSFRSSRMLEDAVFDLMFYSADDGALHSQCSSAGLLEPPVVEAGDGSVEFEVPILGLQPGVYSLGVTVTERGARRPCAWQYGRAMLYVGEGAGRGGRFYMPHVVRHGRSPSDGPRTSERGTPALALVRPVGEGDA